MAGQGPTTQTYNMVAVLPKRDSNSHLRRIVTSPDVKHTGRLPSVPNFRNLAISSSRSFTNVYRSSRPDLIGEEDLKTFKKLGIKCILDFRSKQEYLSGSGDRLLDVEFQVYRVKFPKGRNYFHNEPVKVECLDPQLRHAESVECLQPGQKKHYLINFFTFYYIWKLFNTAPWYFKFVSIFCLLYDFVFKTGHKHFIRLFARTTLNSKGLLGQYKHMIEHSQTSICAALKLLCIPSNCPALMNCAHGKDRTGIISALVLYCLGESLDYIADEYALSEEGLEPVRENLMYEMVEQYHMSEEFTSARADTMKQLIVYISERYGSVDSYLNFIGFSDREQDLLRRNLLGH